LLVVTTGQRARTPVGQQRVEAFTQAAAAGAWRGLAKTAEQSAQLDQLLHPVDQQAPVAIEAVLLGQALAAAQQVPGDGGKGIVERLLGAQWRRRQSKVVAGRVEQSVAALRLADVAGHQRQV